MPSNSLDIASVVSGPDDIISGNRVLELCEERGIPCGKLDYINDVSPREGWPLVTHNGGYNLRPGPRNTIAITSLGIAEFVEWPEGVTQWFGLNACFDSLRCDHKMHGLPLGIMNWYKRSDSRHHTLPPSGEGPALGAAIIDAIGKPRTVRNRVLMNWRNDTAPYERKSAWIALSPHPWATWIDGGVGSPTRLGPREYVDALMSHEFVACPEGNGIDCHRIWEALYLGAVPIVKRCHALDWFDVLPILYVDDWEDLTEDGLDGFWDMSPAFDLGALRVGYWIDLIAQHIEAE